MNFSQSAARLLPTWPGTTVSLSPTGPVDTWNASLWSGTSWSQAPSTGWAWNGTAWNGADWNGWAWNNRAWNAELAGAAWNGADWTGWAWNDAAWAARPGPAPPGSARPGTAQHGADMARSGSQAMKMPRATGAIVAASVAGGALTLLVAVGGTSAPWHVGESQWIIAAAVGALALGSWVWPVVVYRGGESAAFNMDEGFFVILALLVPPLVTLGTLALATVAAQVVRRRPLLKSAFNVGQVLIAAGLGLAVSRAIAAPSNSLTAGQIAAVMPRRRRVLRRSIPCSWPASWSRWARPGESSPATFRSR